MCHRARVFCKSGKSDAGFGTIPLGEDVSMPRTSGRSAVSQTTVEELITEIATLARPGLVERLRELDTGFPLDFDKPYMDQLSLDELRHLVLAASLQARRRAQARRAAS